MLNLVDQPNPFRGTKLDHRQTTKVVNIQLPVYDLQETRRKPHIDTMAQTVIKNTDQSPLIQLLVCDQQLVDLMRTDYIR